MGIFNIILIFLSTFNIIYSLNTILDAKKKGCCKTSSSSILFIILFMILLSSIIYVPLEIFYVSNEKLPFVQDLMWSLYELLTHIIKVLIIISIKYRNKKETKINQLKKTNLKKKGE
jgi:hypothetical protein